MAGEVLRRDFRCIQEEYIVGAAADRIEIDIGSIQAERGLAFRPQGRDGDGAAEFGQQSRTVLAAREAGALRGPTADDVVRAHAIQNAAGMGGRGHGDAGDEAEGSSEAGEGR
jgi:hypothetical protein